MKKVFSALLIVATLAFAGCVASNPDYPATSSEPYRTDPALTNTATILRAVSVATAPANPYAPISDYAVESGLGLAALISAFMAKRKNDEANRQKSAADSLAQLVVSKGLVTEALAIAGENKSSEVVAHLEANKSVTGSTER